MSGRKTLADYTALDEAILACIKSMGPVPFSTISSKVSSQSEPLARTDRQDQAWRVVDRRLQALRRDGKIKFARKPEGWVTK